MKEPIHLRCTMYDVRLRNLARLRLAENGRRLQGRLASPQGCPEGAKAREASLRQMRSVSEGGGWNYARRWLQSGGDGGGWRRPEADRVCLCTMEDVRFGL